MTISIRMLNCKGIEEQYTLSKKWNRVSSHLDKEVREKKESTKCRIPELQKKYMVSGVSLNWSPEYFSKQDQNLFGIRK